MISITNLTKYYPQNPYPSLDNVTMTIERGTVLGLIGTNGAGKSTLLRILSGIFREDSGKAQIDGFDIFENNEIKNKISYVSDDQYWPAGATIRSMGKIYSGFFEGFSEEKMLELSKTFDLDADRKVSTFSKGMRRQGEVILALSKNPDYLFCDETFDGLDPMTREKAKREIAREVAERNMTVILSSHNLRELEDICDHIALINKGKLQIDKNLYDIKDSLKKYQVVFDKNPDRFPLEEASFITYSGRMISFVCEGDIEVPLKIAAAAMGLEIVYFEAIPLTLEEIFTYEVERLQEGERK